jgi:hypothetical protein
MLDLGSAAAADRLLEAPGLSPAPVAVEGAEPAAAPAAGWQEEVEKRFEHGSTLPSDCKGAG